MSIAYLIFGGFFFVYYYYIFVVVVVVSFVCLFFVCCFWGDFFDGGRQKRIYGDLFVYIMDIIYLYTSRKTCVDLA